MTGTPSQSATFTYANKSVIGVEKLSRKLKLRGANPERSTNDPLLQIFRDMLNVYQKIQISSKDALDLRPIFQDFLDKLENNDPTFNLYSAIEIFQDSFNNGKPAHKLFSISNRDFDFDRKCSYENNEAILQRTVLTSILDRLRMNKMFRFDCEGH